ncbi:DNA damage-inducible protein DinB [Microtetraspora sp. NBRC 13810]|uniref:DinB family protein n=1 Tax=Microtetraspora sp. NBRC 13810 TaxID=3030990 RepID=UPI0024A2CA25|nr:DinB family protein [Microtetraspora sp. NBRC 13810]GLW10298.1 DNA damage-inducible protein DinB [Microtetraspora sp. NBRC 13810]
MNAIPLLRWQLDVSWSLTALNLEKLTDEECVWEPAPGSWSVRPQSDGSWAADWAMPEPDPVPMTSVGWVMWHVGFWWDHAYSHTFGDAYASGKTLDFTASAAVTPWPGSAEAGVAWLTACRDRWAEALDSLTEDDLGSTARSGWFAGGDLPLGQVLAWVNIELMKNAGEIGLLRRLRTA